MQLIKFLPLSVLIVSSIGLMAETSYGEEVGIRIRFGVKDKKNTVWSGSAEVAPGKIDQVSGWRFQFSDKVEGTSWKAETRSLTVRKSNNPKKAAERKTPMSRWQTTM
jgi:hypothetical protein